MIKNHPRWPTGFGDRAFIEPGAPAIRARSANWIFIAEYKGNDKDMDVTHIPLEALIHCVEDFEEQNSPGGKTSLANEGFCYFKCLASCQQPAWGLISGCGMEVLIDW